MTKIMQVYEFVKANPGATFQDMLNGLGQPKDCLSNILHNLGRGKYLRHDVVLRPNGGGRYYKYYNTTKYIKQNGRLEGTSSLTTHRKPHKKVTPHKTTMPVPAAGTNVGVALMVEGKQVVIPLKAAKNVYLQLKEIFA